MKIEASFFVLPFLALLAAACPIQAQEVHFNRVTPQESTYFGMTNGVTQDSQGYMWFSAYGSGLYRYDGYHVTRFRNDPRDPGSLASDDLACVFKDHNGFIWVGTTGSGLDRLDPVTGIFTHFRHKKEETASLSDDGVITILEDNDGSIWVGTENGLNRLDQQTGTFTRYQQNPTDATTLSCNRVQVVYKDHQGTIWIGTGSPKNFYSSNEQGGLNRLDRKTGKFTRYLHDPKDSLSLINDRIGAIFEDSRGVFWVSTAGDGLHTMDRKKGIFERHPYDLAHPEKLSGPPPEKEVGLDLNNFFLTEDASGAIWIASSKRWVTRYDPKTKKVNHFDSFNGDVQAVQSVTEVFSSHEGVLWFTTWGGTIFQVDPFKTTIPHVFTGSIVHAVHEDVSGTLWLGTYGEGLIQTDGKKGSAKRFFTDLPGPYGLSDSWVPAIYEGDDSTLWIGSSNGLNHYYRKTKIFTRYVNDPKNETSLTKGFVTAIAEDKPGSLWIATEGGLNRFDIKSGIFTHHQNDPKDSTSLFDNNISSLLKDHSGNLWAGNWCGTLNLFNSRTGKFRRFPCRGNIGSIIEAADNTIWVGTSNGLYRSNTAVDTFSLLTDPEIGLTATTIITYILEDDKKNLWVGSSAGILRFSPNRNEFNVYSKNQGVDASGLTFPLMHGEKGKRGEFFFGDRTGYYAFFPNQLKGNVTPPQVVITDFLLTDQLVKPGKGSLLSQPITQTKEISLDYTQNVFSFEFAGIHYSSPEDIRIFFLMENLENTWRKAGLEKKAFYYNVPPGRYIFRVKAANRDGVWGEKAITVIINPPWFQTWWAYLVYVSGFIMFIWIFSWYRSRRLKAENLLLEKKVLNERLRISRELHDDIGSTLGSISIYSEVARKRTEKNENTKEALSKIGLASRELIDKMGDIVWSLNPNNESFEQLQNRMLAFAAMMLAPRNILYDFVADAALKKIQLTSNQRKNIFLIFKEALHNIVKYANCKKVSIALSEKNNHLMMMIKDDGKGFDGSQITGSEIFPQGENLGGNGIKNMHARADDIKAKLCIDSTINEGTTIQLTLQI
jgi:ligand-binding sensor domain-containing protein/anti-sigma regulatory factor (Ser/Thr protein kinase)